MWCTRYYTPLLLLLCFIHGESHNVRVLKKSKKVYKTKKEKNTKLKKETKVKQVKKLKQPKHKPPPLTDNPSKSPTTSTTASPTSSSKSFRSLPAFNSEMMNGYKDCSDFVEDLQSAAFFMAQLQIDTMALQYYHGQHFYSSGRGGGLSPYYPMMESMSTTTAAAAARGESSYETNNQVTGVDEADSVKSDGNYIYTAYGDAVIVVNASTGVQVARTVLPTTDDEGIPLCSTTREEEEEDDCYDNYSWQQLTIASLLLHENRLVVIGQSTYSMNARRRPNSSILSEHKATRIYMYDTSTINDSDDKERPSQLVLMTQKDLNGRYQSARAINQNVHIVTSSSINVWNDLYQHLDPYQLSESSTRPRPRPRPRSRSYIVDEHEHEYEYEVSKLSETDYRQTALQKAELLIPKLAHKLAQESRSSSDTCSNMVRLALYSKSNKNPMTSRTTTPFTSSNVLTNLVQVTSFDMLQDNITTHTSSVFTPLNTYSKSVYANNDTLIIAGEAYEQENDDDNWTESTVLFSFALNKNQSVPQSMGVVPGSLLNQFSMDIHNGYVRVATTSWARWGFQGDVWTQEEESVSHVTVLETSSTNTMPIVGQVTNLGKGERIYAVRFMGEKAFVVTFQQIDPFYTLDMADPNNPKVVGELKILGFSNYIHLIDETTVLTVGQDADVNGVQLGLQIAVFNVTDFANPIQEHKYVAKGGRSDAQYDHKAFRYLHDSHLLIVPLEQQQRTTRDERSRSSFDGFVVYTIPTDDSTTQAITTKFEISHYRSGKQYCWSLNQLTPRSLVFDGTVVTLKGHTILSHSLESKDTEWILNLDSSKPTRDDDDICYGWWF